MSKKVSHYKDINGNHALYFHCPGCGHAHSVFIEGKGVPIWKWNGDEEKPTITKSILVNGYLGKKNGKKIYGKCHSYVTDGKIRFLDDCTHKLKGETVELPNF